MAQITIDEILMIEAHAQAMLDLARKMREKLTVQEWKAESKMPTAARQAELRAQRLKTRAKGRERYLQAQKAGE